MEKYSSTSWYILCHVSRNILSIFFPCQQNIPQKNRSCSPTHDHLLMFMFPSSPNNIPKLFVVLWLKVKSNQHISWNHLWHTNNIWTSCGPNKSLQKGVGNPKTAQDITKVKVKVMVERLPPFWTYAITWTLSPWWFTYKAMELPNVFVF
jgi:hypothetical protein